MKKEFTYKGKYTKDVVLLTMDLLNQGTEIRTIAKQVGVPETTITNWKSGYTQIYGKKRRICDDLKKTILIELNSGLSIPQITKKHSLYYSDVRFLAKNLLSKKKYGEILALNRELLDRSKLLSPELAYVLGVIYGDGYFGPSQIGLGTIDQDFRDYFVKILTKWSGKKPSTTQRLMKGTPYYECFLSFKNATEFVQFIVKKRVRLPQQILDSKDERILSMFVKGFSDSEGSIVVSNSHRSCTLKMSNQKILVLEQIRDIFFSSRTSSKRKSFSCRVVFIETHELQK